MASYGGSAGGRTEFPAKVIRSMRGGSAQTATTGASMPGVRMCFALDLKDDPALIEQYRRFHAPGGPPAAVTHALRASGIQALEIYLCGNRLFMVLEGGPDFSLQAKAQADASNPEVHRWEELMWQFQKALPWAAPGQKWVPAERIYDLVQQPD